VFAVLQDKEATKKLKVGYVDGFIGYIVWANREKNSYERGNRCGWWDDKDAYEIL
jgi:hypothetical protein